jgi:hypothetical protein
MRTVSTQEKKRFILHSLLLLNYFLLLLLELLFLLLELLLIDYCLTGWAADSGRWRCMFFGFLLPVKYCRPIIN